MCYGLYRALGIRLYHMLSRFLCGAKSCEYVLEGYTLLVDSRDSLLLSCVRSSEIILASFSDLHTTSLEPADGTPESPTTLTGVLGPAS